jgi:hypothetical protein
MGLLKKYSSHYPVPLTYGRKIVNLFLRCILFLDSNINGQFTTDVIAHIFEVLLPHCCTKNTYTHNTLMHSVVYHPYNCWYCFPVYCTEVRQNKAWFSVLILIKYLFYSPVEKKVWIMYLIFSPSLALLRRQTFLMYQSRSL